MSKIVSPHDKFFKAAMANQQVAIDFFSHHLPGPVKSRLNLNSLQLRRESYINQQLKLSASDLLYAVDFEGKSGYLYTLIEHQSTPDKLMPFRMLDYMCSIMKQHLKETGSEQLPPIYCMVFYHGKVIYPYSTDLFSLFGEEEHFMRQVLFQPFQLIDLNTIPDEELEQHPWAGALEILMKHILTRDVGVFVEKIVALLKSIEHQGGGDYAVSLIEYLLLAGNISDEQSVIQALQDGLSQETQEKIMTLAEHYRKEAKIEVAINLLKKGVDKELVAEATHLPLEQIEKLEIEKRSVTH